MLHALIDLPSIDDEFEAIIQAVEAVKSGKMSTNQAARAHNVPSQRLCMNDMLPSISSEEKVLKLYLLASVEIRGK